MAKPNQYFPYNSDWNQDEWNKLCPNSTYRVIGRGDFPTFLPSELTDQFNCAVIMASGNDTNQTYVLQGYRVDDTKIDEHQYIATFDLESGECYSGFIHHASYEGRVIDMPSEMVKSIALSGINVEHQFPRKPTKPEGNISEASFSNLIAGFVNSVKVQTESMK